MTDEADVLAQAKLMAGRPWRKLSYLAREAWLGRARRALTIEVVPLMQPRDYANTAISLLRDNLIMTDFIASYSREQFRHYSPAA